MLRHDLELDVGRDGAATQLTVTNAVLNDAVLAKEVRTCSKLRNAHQGCCTFNMSWIEAQYSLVETV